MDPGDGDVYAVYVAGDSTNFGEVYVARSTDRGVTWISSRVTDGSRHSAFPEVAVTDNGSIGVLYVDFDDSGDTTIFRHRLARSFDSGGAWHNETLQAMNPTSIVNAMTGFLWGDYEGLTAARNTFYGVFTGEGSGRATPQLDPVFFRQKSCRWWSLSCWFERE